MCHVIFAVEAWDPDFGTGGDAEALDASTDVVRADVEVPLEQWRAIRSSSPPAQGVVYFVDGVRRIDARIWVTDGGRVLPGSCATVAAGAVACTPGRAEVRDVQVLRAVFTPPAESASSIVTDAGEYVHVAVKTGSPEDLYLGIHEQMTELETRTIPLATSDDLIVFDGPLRGRAVERAIGLIKTQHVQYLDEREQIVVSGLDEGERTPLFVIGTSRFARWSWYLRLPGPRTHGWAGIVRCEMATGTHLPVGYPEQATELADLVSATLPRYASEPHKENRAPQNLYPIKGLEQALRRRLGDQRLLQRALLRASAEA
ncbi:MAG: hypothetical protein ACI81L_000258 [Verrucomicrobiales bacterium]